MMSIRKTIWMVAVGCWLTACYGGSDHEGDDTIQQVIAVEGISANTYTLYQGDTLRLTPKVAFSVGADTTRYDYRWLVGRQQLMGEGRSLEWVVRLPDGYSFASSVPAVFIAHDRSTGLEFRKTFSMEVLSSYTPSYFCVYETTDGCIEWLSLQGEPTAFTRWFDGMIKRINPSEPLTGQYRGTLYSMNEFAVFTDRHPDYGRTISVRNADPQSGFPYNVGEYTGTVHDNMYHGSEPELDISNVNFGYGASKYFICNKTLHVFSGLDRRLPVFNEQTFVKSQHVVQAISSKQFQRYKKCTFVLHDDGSVGAYHVYDDQMERLQMDGQPLRLDSLCGCFTEATGMGSNQPYDVFLIGRQGSQYTMFQFHVNYINRVVQPLTLVRRMPLQADFARTVQLWWGSFGESYAFYLQQNEVHRFDYYEMEDFHQARQRTLITFDPADEVTDVVLLTPGMGLRDEDDCTVVMLYHPARHCSSLYVYNTTTGRQLAVYRDIIPGRAVFFAKCQ